MGKWIFRKIAGRIIRIRVGSVGDVSGIRHEVARKVTATLVEGAEKTRIGTMHLGIPKKGTHATVYHVAVEEKFQRQGIAKELFKHAQALMGRVGKKFIRSEDLQHPAQVAIRDKAGKSRFYGDGSGAWGLTAKRLSTERAKQTAKLMSQGKAPKDINRVFGTTLIPKNLRRKK